MIWLWEKIWIGNPCWRSKLDPLTDPGKLASELDAQIHRLPRQYTEEVRQLRRKYSDRIKTASPEYVLAFARHLLLTHGQRWVAYEILRCHPAAFQRLGIAELEELGQGIDSWWTVDTFARTLSGPAWLKGQIPDETILHWAHSPDPWRRRAALVSTVALNVRSQGGRGDIPRTLAVCRILIDDHADMVVKAMSWALRELVVHDPQVVQKFLDEHKDVLAARVRREVMNKLRTGLKTPRRK